MTLNSQVIITSQIDDTISELEALKTTERIVKILEEDKAFSVLNAKEAIEKAYMASEETTVIILTAKTFSPIVQNKLLKVIEEPPKNKEFILITQSKSTILDTIRSRLPITIRDEEKEEEILGLDVSQLSLSSVYEFIQTHKRTDAKTMQHIIESISKEISNYQNVTKVLCLDDQKFENAIAEHIDPIIVSIAVLSFTGVKGLGK